MNIASENPFDEAAFAAEVERLAREHKRKREPAQELKDAGLGQRDALLAVADDAKLWRTPDGETYATLEVDGHAEHHGIGSRAFKDWLLAEVADRYLSNGRPASVGETALRDARQALEASASVGRVKHEAPLRVVDHEGVLLLDLGRDDWEVVEVTAAGWQVVPRSPVPIIRTKRTAAMPAPAASGDFEPLRRILGRLGADDFILFAAWCLAALYPNGPYPVLILGGEAGSGKSTLARMAQRITDPVNGDLLQPPSCDRDLIAAARQGRVLAFDNISTLKVDMADSICRLSTGAEIGGRALFTDYDSATFAACRPILLNGIPDLATRGDLADRSLVIRLPALDGRVTEREIRREIDEVAPVTLAALLDALALGLRRLSEVPTPNIRMADFAQLIVAAEPALPWKAGDFLAAYSRNRARAVAALLDGDLVASKVRDFASQFPSGWSGLMSELYRRLSDEVPIEAKRHGDWPANVRWFSDRITRATPALRAIGIGLRSRHGERGTTTWIENLASVVSVVSANPLRNDATDATDAKNHIHGDASGPDAWGPDGYLDDGAAA